MNTYLIKLLTYLGVETSFNPLGLLNLVDDTFVIVL